MIQPVRAAAVLATALLAAPALALAQPGPDATTSPSPPVTAGTVVIVTPEQPIITPPGQSGGAAAPVAPPAPQTHDWRNVSHINGQIVKVGEQGEYLYDNGKRTNFSSNPIGWMFGFYGASLAFAVHPNIAIRGDVNLYRVGNSSGHEVGVSVPIYFRRTFSGPYLEPGIVTRNLNDDCDDCRDASTGPEMLFGWHWMFDSGLNVSMALGALRNMNSSSRSIDAEPTGYFRIGYAF
jgi:hypothetical protein